MAQIDANHAPRAPDTSSTDNRDLPPPGIQARAVAIVRAAASSIRAHDGRMDGLVGLYAIRMIPE
jgi:hypothetical protein